MILTEWRMPVLYVVYVMRTTAKRGCFLKQHGSRAAGGWGSSAAVAMTVHPFNSSLPAPVCVNLHCRRHFVHRRSEVFFIFARSSAVEFALGTYF